MEILTGARVLTMDPACPEAAAVALGEGSIVAVGSVAELRAELGASVPVTDLGGGALLPGFIDAHHHLAYAALNRGAPELRLPARSHISALLQIIKEAAPGKAQGWVYLYGYEPDDVRERRAPRAGELEECCPGRPLFVQAANAHEGA